MVSAKAAQLLQEKGPNALGKEKKEPLWRIYIDEFKSPVVLMLVTAALICLGVWVLFDVHGCLFDPREGQRLAGCQILRGSFSPVWTATIARKDAFCRDSRDLQSRLSGEKKCTHFSSPEKKEHLAEIKGGRFCG